MIINSIELKGHGSYRDYNKVELPLGITGIVGEYDGNPLKSNGSGKSTLIMSILYALFGAGEYKVLKELVNDSMKDDEMFVKLNYDMNGSNYFLERGMRGSSSYLDFKCDGIRRGDEDKIKIIQPEIIKTLNMDYSMFTASGFFEQNALDKFINTESEVLRQYINKILGIELWRDVSKVSNRKNTKMNENISSVTEEIEKLEEVVEKIEKDLIRKVQVETEIKNVSYNLNKRRETFSQFIILQSKIKTVDELGIKIQKIIYSIQNVEVGIDTEKEKVEKIKKDIEEKEKGLSELYEISEKEINDIEFALDTKRNLRISLGVDLRDINEKLSTAKRGLKDAKFRKGNLEVGKCFRCEQDITQEYVNKFNGEVSQEIEKYSKEVDTLLVEQEKILDKLKNVDEEVSNLSKDSTKLRNLLNMYNTNSILLKESIKSHNNLLEVAEKNLTSLNNRWEEMDTEKKELDKEYDKINAEIPKDIHEKINEVEKEIEKLEIELNNLNIELGKLNQLEEAYNEHQKLLKDEKKELKQAKKDAYIYNVLTTQYKNYARYKFEDSVSSIQNVANGIIHQILPEMSVKFYEDDSKLKRLVVGFTINGKERSYKRLSGGQKTVANIGLRLGFSKIIQARAKSNIEFVVLDEPFGALDENNRELVSRMFTVMLQWFKQIFVISHVQNVRDFPNTINVGMTLDNVSYIRGG